MFEPKMPLKKSVDTEVQSALCRQDTAQDFRSILRRLAQFDLYAVTCDKEEGIAARLHGPTFPISDLLEASGAVWDKPSQSWTFYSEKSLRQFSESLDQSYVDDQLGLAEEASRFAGCDNLDKPLGRFLALGANALDNEELLALILSFDQYLVDPSATSKHLFDEFGSLGAVLGSETMRLGKFEEVTPRVRGLLKAIQLTIERVLHESIEESPIIGSWQALLDYLSIRLRHRQREELLILFLDRGNRLINTESIEGTINHVPLYPREIAARALELFSNAVIIAHNHPGRDTTPSKQDIETTRLVARALDALGIQLYDHVIVGGQQHSSFRAEGLL